MGRRRKVSKQIVAQSCRFQVVSVIFSESIFGSGSIPHFSRPLTQIGNQQAFTDWTTNWFSIRLTAHLQPQWDQNEHQFDYLRTSAVLPVELLTLLNPACLPRRRLASPDSTIAYIERNFYIFTRDRSIEIQASTNIQSTPQGCYYRRSPTIHPAPRP